MKYKKVLGLILMFNILLILLICYTAAASTTSPECDFGFNKSSGEITSYYGSGGDVVIPATISGINVTTIGNYAFHACSGLVSITIPSSVTTIGGSAFSYCSGLTSITIPSSVTTIRDDALSHCSRLASITIPRGVTAISDYAFSYCSGLTNITIPSSVTSIGNDAFLNCSGLKSVTIPSGVIAIGNYAFSSCSGLASIIIPSSVTSIGYFAFSSCSSLASITIPNSVTLLRDCAFCNCNSLTRATFIGNAPTIGSNVFLNTASGFKIYYKLGTTGFSNPWNGYPTEVITNSTYSINILNTENGNIIANQTYASAGVTINLSVTPNTGMQLKTGTLKYNDGTSDHIINGTSFIMPGANIIITGQFEQASSPESDFAFDSNTGKITGYHGSGGDVIIPPTISGINVKMIGNSAFDAFSNLTSITIPSGVTTIGNDAFKECSGLTSITIPSSVTSIGNAAFKDCSSLTSITIPSSVTSIGDETFKECSGLTSITIPISITSIGSNAFYNCRGLKGITIPISVTTISESAFSYCSGLTSITIPSSVTTINDSVFSYCNGLTNITIPSSVISIGSNAFSFCSGLTSITIPSSVTTIGDYAFYACSSLESITIPSSVTTISISAFAGCSGATNITIPSSVTTIGNGAFAFCSGITNIIIPSSVTSIGGTAFYFCSNLTNITIPSSVTSISGGAFYGCRHLTSATFLGNAPAMESYVFLNTDSNFKIFYYPNSTGFTNPWYGYATETNGNSLYSINIATTAGGSITLNQANASAGMPINITLTPNIGMQLKAGTLKYNDGISDHFINDTSFIMPAANVIITCQFEEVIDQEGDFAFSTSSGTITAYHGSGGDVVIPSTIRGISVKTIGGSAFYNCSGLTSITIPSSVTSIESSAFNSCSGLTSITIPNSVTSISSYAFSFCRGLTNITIPSSVTSIGDGAFGYCFGLTNITIPSRVTSIGEGAFFNCGNLTSATFLGNAPTMGAYVFSNTASNFKIYYYPGSTGFTNPWYEYPTAICGNSTYSVNIVSTAGGSITVNQTNASAGATINLTITPNTGMQLKAGTLKYNDGTTDHIINGTSFIMPAANVTVSGQFEPIIVNGTISGCISTPTSSLGTFNSCSGVRITIESTNITTTSAIDGTYILANVPEGNYMISFLKDNYVTKTIANISVTTGTTTNKDEIMILIGDINCDGDVNQADYDVVKRYLLGIITNLSNLTDASVADIDVDGNITSRDLAFIRKLIMHSGVK